VTALRKACARAAGGEGHQGVQGVGEVLDRKWWVLMGFYGIYSDLMGFYGGFMGFNMKITLW